MHSNLINDNMNYDISIGDCQCICIAFKSTISDLLLIDDPSPLYMALEKIIDFTQYNNYTITGHSFIPYIAPNDNFVYNYHCLPISNINN